MHSDTNTLKFFLIFWGFEILTPSNNSIHFISFTSAYQSRTAISNVLEFKHVIYATKAQQWESLHLAAVDANVFLPWAAAMIICQWDWHILDKMGPAGLPTASCYVMPRHDM